MQYDTYCRNADMIFFAETHNANFFIQATELDMR